MDMPGANTLGDQKPDAGPRVPARVDSGHRGACGRVLLGCTDAPTICGSAMAFGFHGAFTLVRSKRIGLRDLGLGYPADLPKCGMEFSMGIASHMDRC